MAVVMAPPRDAEPWPTLGPQVVAWIEEHLVFGPGDLRGKPVRLDREKRGLICRTYEVYPKGHPRAGRRRFKRAAWSLRKGLAKTELAAMVAAVELHPDGPVRCDGFDAFGQPVGVGVTDPYIPLVAYTEEQSDELCYAALKAILEGSSVADDFDIGLERIVRRGGDGRAVSLAAAPDARDGARTTFQVVDESHRWTLPRLRTAHTTMLANIPKRRAADGWCLEVTTAFVPGEDSVAERTWRYAQQVLDGAVEDPRLFFFHRQASDTLRMVRVDGSIDLEAARTAVLEATGAEAAAWSDIDGIVAQFAEPGADISYLSRVWLNRPEKSSDQAFDFKRWSELARPGYEIPDGAAVTLGFDGSRYEDATALVATEIATGFQQVLGVWEKPIGAKDWEVPELEVDATVAAAFERWQVWRLYADPPYWESTVAKWAGQYGAERAVSWPTNRWVKMAEVLRAYAQAMRDGSLSHDGDARFGRHLANAVRRPLAQRDEKGRPLWVVQKERQDSPNKIDALMAGALSWAAHLDAIKAGVNASGGAWDGQVTVLGADGDDPEPRSNDESEHWGDE